MKKIIILIGLILLLAPACKKQTVEVTTQNNVEQRPVCGMEEAMASMSAEMRQDMRNESIQTEVAATELLLFLDFDGATVVSGFPSPTGYRSPLISGTRYCPAPSLSAAQIEEVIQLVKDDFSPFKIVVTTDQSVFNTYPASNKQLCIITTIPTVIGMPNSIGGVAPFAGLSFRLPFNPSFVFANLFGGDLAEIAITISHEVAHTMGLGHQSLYNNSCALINEYHPGFGNGLLGFGPIMGNGGKRISNWFDQPCINPNSGGGPQNDFALLNSQVNVKEDDFPNEAGNPGSHPINVGGPMDGILEQAGDVDYILINFQSPGPVTITSENIDLKVSLYNPGGGLISEYNDAEDTHVIIPAARGLAFLKVEAVSNTNMSSQFMTGKYKITY
ncbi:hypothetical protein CAP36_10515 [Chitinophagaceae bacterium IBVUCB2]|nr:hypothetical protein CAP36_10515 [Chitinophagaceae bacterium IBVUCB2]